MLCLEFFRTKRDYSRYLMDYFLISICFLYSHENLPLWGVPRVLGLEGIWA